MDVLLAGSNPNSETPISNFHDSFYQFLQCLFRQTKSDSGFILSELVVGSASEHHIYLNVLNFPTHFKM